LALLDIQFYNLNKEPLYSFEDLLNRDSKNFEDSLLQAGAKDVFATYDALKEEKGDKWDVLKKPLEQGRYAGRSIFDVMQFCTAKDVYTFLNFVKSYPGKYIGNSWKLNETFATWVMNKAPLGKREVIDSVQAYKNKPQQLKQFLANNLKEIKDKAFVNDWLSDASEAASDGMLAEAQLLYESAKMMLPYLQEDCTTAYYYYTYTSYTDYKKDYKQTLKYIDTSIIYFTKCGNAYFSVQTLLKKGLIYYSMDRNEEALTVFDAMYAEIEKQNAKLKPTQKTAFLAKYNHFTGILLAIKGELKIAAERYEKAIGYYQSLGNYSNLQSAIGVQGRLARLYKRQGELQKSLAIYNQQYALYSKLNDYKNIADVLDNIASIEFSLGNYRKAISNYEAAKYIYLQIPNMDNAGFSQSNIGQAFWNLGKYDSAIAAHQLAISYRRQANSFTGLGYSWKKIGGLYKETGEKSNAFIAYDSASYYYTLAKDSASLKSLLSDIGDVYYNDKQYQKAFANYQKWHDLNVQSNDKPAMANSGYQLADAANYFDVPLAKKLAITCLDLSKSIGDKTNEYNAATLLGFIAFKNYDYDEGNKYFNQGLAVAIGQKNKKQEASCYRFMGLAYSNKLDFDNAQKYLRRSIAISDSLGDKTVLPSSYRFLGNSIQSKGDFYEARKQYQKAIETAYTVNSRADVGYGYSALTFLYIIQGELSKAEQVTDSAYAIFQGLNNSWQIAEAYFNKGLVYEAKTDGINAVKYYSMADSIYQQEKDLYSQSTCKTNIACVFYYQADFDKALDYFFQADKMLATIKVTTEAHILSPINLGETYYYKKDFAKAEPYLIKGYQMAIDKKAGRMQTIAASFLGTLYYDLKKYELSEKYLLEGFALAQKSNETDLYINSGMYLGKLYAALNQPQKSQEYFGKTVAFIKTIDNSKYTWMALYEYGLSLYNNKQLDSAVVYFKKAVEIVENSAQKLFGGAEAKKIYNADERKVDLYNKLVASLAKLGKKEEALYYADKTNNQAVKEQMEKAGLVTNDKEKEEALKKGGELLQKKNAVDQAIAKEKAKPEKEQNKQLIASLETVKNVAETDYTNFIEGLQRKYPDLQAYFSNTNPKDFKNYIEDIPDSTLVALYVVNDNQLLIFTVTNKETGIKTIDLKQDINKQAAHFLSVLRNPKNATGTGAVTLRSTLKPIDDVRGDFKSEATDLYNLLITPLADQLKDKKNLCIITNGKLGSIPFQCLGIVDDKKEFHFLVEDKAIFYTSKIDIFRKAYKNRPMQSSLTVLGNPDKSLPGATEEAKEIGKIVPTATVYIEEQATENKAIEGLQKFNYVHFATHGVLDYNNFEDSYLLFAKDANGNDGKLTIKEINGLSKQTNSLVVLSACETAVSKEEVKGWYISPANAFLTNRCDAVLATFWKVPDETTNLLLQEFYKNISKEMTKVEALRHAQAAVSQNPKYSHPFYWAAFLLNGEWR
jgi:CHAT domain-containing protein